MQQKVNYILHLNRVFEQIISDQRLTPFHVSLYFSLFQYWNIAKFRNPISISRDDQMNASKIGSVNTYLRCLKELDQWGYIRYEPSHNPMKGSLVYLFTFDTGTHTSNDTTQPITSNTTQTHGNYTTADTSTETTLKEVVRPSINSLNNTNKSNKKNEHEHTRKKSSQESSFVITKLFNDPGAERKKVARKKESADAGFKRPVLQAVSKHFSANEWPAIEAEKFFNYYQSNGWLVGGKTPMRSWKAAASNWMINSKTFNHEKDQAKNKSPAGRARSLSTEPGKDYSEPL
jgi:hypothetical protein